MTQKQAHAHKRTEEVWFNLKYVPFSSQTYLSILLLKGTKQRNKRNLPK